MIAEPEARSGYLPTMLGPVLAEALGNPYFKLKPPRTAGREQFGREYSAKFMTACQRLSNRPEDALNQLHVAQGLEPNDAVTHFFTGVVALRVGLLPEAERCFREALRLDPQNEDARHNLGLLEPLVRPTREERLSLGEAGAERPARVDIERAP